MLKLLIISLAFIVKRRSACSSGGTYSKEQEQWCKEDVEICARFLCNGKTNLDCDKNQIAKIVNMLECKFEGKCDSLKNTERNPCINEGDCQQGSQCRDGFCRPVFSGQNCVFDGQCDFYYLCENRRYCILNNLTPCSDISSCDIGLRCVAGYCRPKYSRNICFKDGQCPLGYNCDRSINKCNIIEPSKTGDCTTSEQCEIGFKCRQGACLGFQLGKNCSGYDDQCRNVNYECAESHCVLKNPLKTCRSSLDCDAGQYCKGRQCTLDNQETVRKDALSGSDTVLESTSVRNLKMRRSSGQQCDADMGCPIGQRCRNKTCLPTKQVLRCSSDNDCDTQYSCKDRECVLVDNVQGSMYMQRSLKSCQNTKQCPSGTKCLANRCRFYKQGKACRSDGECNYYYGCENGQCLLKNVEQCSNDDDCNENFTCSSGLCSVNAYTKCQNDSQCSSNFRCYSASCIPIARSSTMDISKKLCSSGLECSLSERCENGACVQKRTG